MSGICKKDYEEKTINKKLHCRYKGDRFWQEVKNGSNS